jgi:hypothetical protein
MAHPVNPKAYPPVFEQLVTSFTSLRVIEIKYPTYRLANRQRNLFYGYRRACGKYATTIRDNIFDKKSNIDSHYKQSQINLANYYTNLYNLSLTYQADISLSLDTSLFHLTFIPRNDTPLAAAMQEQLNALNIPTSPTLLTVPLLEAQIASPNDLAKEKAEAKLGLKFIDSGASLPDFFKPSPLDQDFVIEASPTATPSADPTVKK